MSTLYAKTYRRSIDDPEGFWREAASAIDWDAPPSNIVGRSENGVSRWFEGGMLNSCHNAVDRHVDAGHGDRTALIYHSEMTGRNGRYTYAEMRGRVARIAGMLAARGTKCGDRVLIYMPMIPEAVFAMLACARLGAVHVVVFGGFAAAELAKRIDDAEPAIILTASCGLEPGRVLDYKSILDEAIEFSSTQITTVIVMQRPERPAELVPGRDFDWDQAEREAVAAPCVSVPSEHPLYLLYTSGTTGIPKAVVHDNGGHAVALTWSLPNIYGVKPGDTMWTASDIGWAVGHSYIVYAPLFLGCTTVLYEGKPVGTPDAGVFWRIADRYKVDVLFTAPTALRAIRREDPDGRLIPSEGVGQLRALFLAGERADASTLVWAEQNLRIPVIDHWWQTELGWPALATSLGLGETDVRHGSAGRPVPGHTFAVLSADGEPLENGEAGDLSIRLPLPPGTLTGLWRKPEHFYESYLGKHPGYYLTGDTGFIDEDGFVHVMGRIDDIINVAGHRLSTGQIEQIIATHPDVAECAVVGAFDQTKGMVPLAVVVRNKNSKMDDSTLRGEVVHRVRNTLGAVAALKTVAISSNLPKTRSGKILRATIRDLANGNSVNMPPTIDNPEALAEVARALKATGFGRIAADLGAFD